jgi:hypothetical protein
MSTILIVFGVLIFLIVPVIYITGAFSCYDNKTAGILGNKLGRFEQFNVILTLLAVAKPKMSDLGNGPGFGNKPVCGFSIISTYFFQSTFLFYILPMVGFAMILFGALTGGSPTQNTRGYRGSNNGSGNNGNGAIQGGRRRK